MYLPQCEGYRLLHLGNHPLNVLPGAGVRRPYPYMVSSHTVLGSHARIEANANVVVRNQVNFFGDAGWWREWLFRLLTAHKFQLDLY